MLDKNGPFSKSTAAVIQNLGRNYCEYSRYTVVVVLRSTRNGRLSKIENCFVASSFECSLFSSFLITSLDVMGGRSRWLYALLTASVSRAYSNPAVSPSYGRYCLGYTIRSLEDRVPPMVQDHSDFCHLNHYQIKEKHRSKVLPFTFGRNGWWVGENYGIRACQCSGCISI